VNFGDILKEISGALKRSIESGFADNDNLASAKWMNIVFFLIKAMHLSSMMGTS
jgi:hypothetical protein